VHGRESLLVALVAAAGLIAALAVTLAATSREEVWGDEMIADWFQESPLPGHDLADVVQTITATEVVLATGAAIALILWLRGYRRQAVLLAGVLVVGAFLQPLLKEIVDRPRPDPSLVERRSGFESSSFPSGHVMAATVLYGSLLYIVLSAEFGSPARPALITACALLVIAPAIVGVWLGVHWPSDVLGGWLWGTFLVACLVLVNRALTAPNS
jgi:undecaprenyl-diphosphatase